MTYCHSGASSGEAPSGWMIISGQLAYISIYLHTLDMLSGVIQGEHLNNRCAGCGEASSRWEDACSQKSNLPS